MKTHLTPPRAKRRGLVLPIAIGLGLMANGCASSPGDPYTDSAAMSDQDKEMLPPNGTAAALMRVALATRAAGDYASAINVLKRAHSLTPNDVGIILEMGESLSAVGAYNEAREIMLKAVTLAPTNTRALRGLGNALVALSEPALAVGHYRAALKIKPEAATHNGLGVAQDMLGDVKGAAKTYRAGLALNPTNTNLIGNLGLSLALNGKNQEAIKLMASEMQMGRSNPRLRQNLALVYGLAGKFKDARTLLRIDLDERAVRNNIAYYEMLRGMPPQRQREKTLGIRAIVASQTSAAVLTVPAPRAKPKKPKIQKKIKTDAVAPDASTAATQPRPEPLPDRPALDTASQDDID